MTVVNPQVGAGLYAPQWTRLVTAAHPGLYNGSLTATLNTVYATRMPVPTTGVLKGLSLFVSTASGNVIGGVYDTGDASNGNRTKLYDSGTIAAGGGWLNLGDPNINVTAGQELDIAFIADNAILVVPKLTVFNGASCVLPAGFLPVPGGASPKLFWNNAPGGFSLPATVAEAACAQTVSALPLLIARVA